MKLITTLFTFLIFNWIYAQCDSMTYTVEGNLITNSTANVKAKLEKGNNLPSEGDQGELLKYFESNLFGVKSTGWLSIAEVTVKSYNNESKILALQVDKELSEMKVNGKKKNHFAKGNLVRMKWKVPPTQEYYTKIEKGDTLVKGLLLCEKRHGIWEYYYPDGQLQERDVYVHGEPDGDYIVYHPNGQIAEKGSYDMGKRTGKLLLFYQDGKKKRIVHYKNDLKHGIYQHYNKGGILDYEVTYIDDKITGPFKYFYEDGRVKEKGTMENGRINGELTGYYPSGAIYFKSGVKDDKKHGDYIKYHENGQIYQEGTYDHDEVIGTFKEYYENGQIAYLTHFKEGELHGKYVAYFENGQLKLQGEYANGIKIGDWQEYYSNGKPKAQGAYNKEGERVDKWFEWDEDGKKSKTKY